MTISDLRCDACGRLLAGPATRPAAPADPAATLPGSAGNVEGVRFVYHPGRPELRDTSGLACQACWDEAVRDFASPAGGHCAACGTPVGRLESLHLRRYDDPRAWRLCAADAVGFLNRLRTVHPKLDPATFRFPFAAGTAAHDVDDPGRGSSPH
jgi:hypothetical protein